MLISSGTGGENTTSDGFFGWDYVGQVNGLTGTYLGDGWVITARHVGPGDLTLDGVVYPWIPDTEVDLETFPGLPADLVMFSVFPYPDLPTLTIRTSPPATNEFVIMIGAGRDRGPSMTWDPNGAAPPPPNELDGWSWAASSTKRWGSNFIEGITPGLVDDTASYFTIFDEGPLIPEAQATAGDSGGAVFTVHPTETEISGIIYAIGPSPGQPAETALFTNATFMARLDIYRPQIEALIALPEPAGSLPVGAVLVAALARRRARRS